MKLTDIASNAQTAASMPEQSVANGRHPCHRPRDEAVCEAGLKLLRKVFALAARAMPPTHGQPRRHTRGPMCAPCCAELSLARSKSNTHAETCNDKQELRCAEALTLSQHNCVAPGPLRKQNLVLDSKPTPNCQDTCAPPVSDTAFALPMSAPRPLSVSAATNRR